MHTLFMPTGQLINIDSLLAEFLSRPAQKVSVDRLITPPKTKVSGYMIKRLIKAKSKFPLLVGTDGRILDGRHRYYKALKLGRKFVNVIYVSDKELESHEVIHG